MSFDLATFERDDYERLQLLLGWHLSIIQQTYKGRPAGIDPAAIVPDALYVVDWRAESPERLDAVKVEWVEAVDREAGEATLRFGFTDLETFASIVVGGPFRL